MASARIAQKMKGNRQTLTGDRVLANTRRDWCCSTRASPFIGLRLVIIVPVGNNHRYSLQLIQPILCVFFVPLSVCLPFGDVAEQAPFVLTSQPLSTPLTLSQGLFLFLSLSLSLCVYVCASSGMWFYLDAEQQSSCDGGPVLVKWR